MRCRRIPHNAKPASRWHRRWCAGCRAAHTVDAEIARGIAQMQAELAPAGGLARTLAAIQAVPIERAPLSRHPMTSLTRLSYVFVGTRRRALMSALVGGALAFSGFCWWRVEGDNPNISVPMPTLPSPNAFDIYVKAGEAVRDISKIDSAVQSSHASKAIKQAGHPYTQGGDLLDAVHREESKAIKQAGHPYTLAEKAALVNENAEALHLLRAGFAYPYLNTPVRSYDAYLPYYDTFRGLARLLTLEGQLKAAHGDWRGAVESNLDSMQTGEEISHGSPLVGMWNGDACQAIGRVGLWRYQDHLNSLQAHIAAARLEKILARHVPYADALVEDKWSGVASLQNLLRHPRQQAWILFNGTWPSEEYHTDESVIPRMALDLNIIYYGKHRIVENYIRYMDRAIAIARLPYTVQYPEPPLPGDVTSQILLPLYARGRFTHAENETQNALLLASLALRAYHLDRHAYPGSLSELVPAYLHQVPQDPFGSNSPLRYRRTGQKYVLYSIGPDGTDDGGKPIDSWNSSSYAHKPSNPPPSRYVVSPSSKGDIVAGINRQ